MNILSRPCAVANIVGGTDAPELVGTVKFYQKDAYVLIMATVLHLPENGVGFFGFHIHAGSACTGDGFSDTGAHFNPTEEAHPRHAGDLPPLLSCGGCACLAVCTDRFRVRDILGRTVVIHDRPDDFTTPPSGASGKKIACGVIRSA